MVVFLGFSFCPIHFRLSTGEANNPETNGYKQKEKMEEEEEKGGKEGGEGRKGGRKRKWKKKKKKRRRRGGAGGGGEEEEWEEEKGGLLFLAKGLERGSLVRKKAQTMTALLQPSHRENCNTTYVLSAKPNADPTFPLLPAGVTSQEVV